MDATQAIAAKLLDIIGSKLRVGWQDDSNVQNEMRNAFEDWFLDVAPAELKISLGLEVVDAIAERVLAVARRRLAR